MGNRGWSKHSHKPLPMEEMKKAFPEEVAQQVAQSMELSRRPSEYLGR